MTRNQKILALTPGYLNGVGPQLLVKAAFSNNLAINCDFFWCGNKNSFYLAAKRAKIFVENFSGNFFTLPNKNKIIFSQKIFSNDLEIFQAQSLEFCVNLAQEKKIDAICTAPIKKNCLRHLPLKNLKGQTEFFAHNLKKENQIAFMAFMGGPFLLSLLTTHVPLKNISQEISTQKIIDHVYALTRELEKLLQKEKKKIKIDLLSLNPHAGEDGLLGYEEKEIFSPALKILRKNNFMISDPLPADGYFSYLHRQKILPDAVIATYHDQGLAPYKLLCQGKCVNVTLGLSTPRTSPAHGTAENLIDCDPCHESTQMAMECALGLIS